MNRLPFRSFIRKPLLGASELTKCVYSKIKEVAAAAGKKTTMPLTTSPDGLDDRIEDYRHNRPNAKEKLFNELLTDLSSGRYGLDEFTANEILKFIDDYLKQEKTRQDKHNDNPDNPWGRY